MAKLHNYYILCPLIDQKSYLGVAEANEGNHVIVTLGRNVVNKYRLSDQKQATGWTSRDHITSPVIYDAIQDKYIGVFQNNTIKMWDQTTTNLDKLKKYKFPIDILKLITREAAPPLIVFTNGNSANLPYAIENRKTYESKSLLRETDTIVDLASWKLNATDYICYVVKNDNGFEIVSCSLRDELGDLDKANFYKEKIIRNDAEDVHVVGKLIHKQNVFILWSDAKLSVFDTHTRSWKVIGSVPWIGTKSAVSMARMGKNHIILFGSNKNQEGAIIVAYNYSLGVASCRYPMKMYRENAKIYCFHKRIVLEASNHIGMLPFTLEIKRNLSSLLGTHEIMVEETPEVADWNVSAKPEVQFSAIQENAIKLGISERRMCAQLIPDLIKDNKYDELVNLIDEFKDLPESVIGVLIKYATKKLMADSEHLIVKQKKFKKAMEEVDSKYFELINKVLEIPVCDALVTPHLREALNVDESLFLLLYISWLLFESDEPLDFILETRLSDWLTLLMDAYYQQYLISRNKNITTTLARIRFNIVQQIKGLHKCSDAIAKLQKMKTSGKKVEVSQNYTIEIMNI